MNIRVKEGLLKKNKVYKRFMISKLIVLVLQNSTLINDSQISCHKPLLEGREWNETEFERCQKLSLSHLFSCFSTSRRKFKNSKLYVIRTKHYLHLCFDTNLKKSLKSASRSTMEFGNKCDIFSKSYTSQRAWPSFRGQA